MNVTDEQREAINSSGKVIVSAAAGSGKTFVMIQKLLSAIERGADLDGVLAVTFTKKAAAQMKEKLRKSAIERIEELTEKIEEGEDAEENTAKRENIKAQLSKIQSADISTIHSFCARVLRTYFYALDIDGTFDIMASDDAQAKEYKSRAISSLFERYYEDESEPNAQNFKLLLSCFKRKRNDRHLRELIFSAYEELRKNVDYEELLHRAEELFTEDNFNGIAAKLDESTKTTERFKKLLDEVNGFSGNFVSSKAEYYRTFGEMKETLQNAVRGGIFAPQCAICETGLPKKSKKDGDAENISREQFKSFKSGMDSRYRAVLKDCFDRDTELNLFLRSGEPTRAFVAVLRDFNGEYASIKRDENKLDYNDLEHLLLQLLKNDEIKREIKGKYSCVFVDEYQDVNPVQERIVESIGDREVFLVGDLKQAIYGFRGSESKHFKDKYEGYDLSGNNALRLSSNFRSSDGVLDFVNGIFSKIMTRESCGIDYIKDGKMTRSGLYPESYGSARIHVFGEEEEESEELKVYSVKNAGKKKKHSKEALAVLEIVKRELGSEHYDLDTKTMVPTQPGDICILTRKFKDRAYEIARVLREAGYSVAGSKGEVITGRPEVKKMIDILSYIDNKQQDIPLATALLSPLGGFTHEELASIRLKYKYEYGWSFRKCCSRYVTTNSDSLSKKLCAFREKIENLRDLSEVLTASQMIDKILEDTYLEAEYSKGEKLKNIRRLAREGENISVSALLAKLKSGYEIKEASPASSDSIKIMTMHSSKGLEFPVVILTDICAGFRGAQNEDDILLSKEYGFAVKCFDEKDMIKRETLLRRLIKIRNRVDELQNELNLFYVACTRAKCNLHILAKEVREFNPEKAPSASCYADLFDMSTYAEDISDSEEESGEGKAVPADGGMIEGEVDTALYKSIKSHFAREYASANSVNLPVKSSASAILKMGEEDSVCVKQLFGGEGETGTERGIAYHRFLELCDFDIKDREGIAGERESFLKEGLISEEQYNILDVDTLTEILGIPIFSTLGGATLYREQEFLCMLPANEIMDTAAPDEVLIQGAIDLLAKTDTGYKVIDYKYSHKSAEKLIETYSRQLALYKKAVARITKTDPKNIQTIIVNIFAKEQINL